MDMFESIGKKYMVSLGYPAMFETRKNEKGEKVTTMLDSGENPPDGVPIYFYIDKKIDDVSISITDSKGNLVRDYSTLNNSMQIKIGTNRFIWDMNHNGAVPNEVGSPPGPMALAGDYNIELRPVRLNEPLLCNHYRIAIVLDNEGDHRDYPQWPPQSG